MSVEGARQEYLLLLEPQAIILFQIESVFSRQGFVPICAGSVQEAADLLENTLVHSAILDVVVDRLAEFAIARLLTSRGIPFIFCTGDEDGISPEFSHIPVVTKPFSDEVLLQTVRELSKPQIQRPIQL